MKNTNCFIVIMAGGKGTRFWPLTLGGLPKQFLDLTSSKQTLLQQAVERVKILCPKENIFIVGNREYGKIIRQQIPFLTQEQVLLEPFGRDTALCIAWATYFIQRKNSQAIVAYMPADHLIEEPESFQKSLDTMFAFAKENNRIGTLGILPTSPNTGFGYIELKEKIQQNRISEVVKFIEKPDLATAEKLIASQKYVWNAGMFIAQVSVLTEEFKKSQPFVHERFENCKNLKYGQEIKDLYNDRKNIKNISFDYAIMEKCNRVSVLPIEVGWSDLGTWSTLYETLQKDQQGNAFQTPVQQINSSGCFVFNNGSKLTALCNVKDLLIVQHKKYLLICNRNSDQDVKKIVSLLKDL